VQRNAMRAFHEQKDFKGLLLDDADVTALLPAAEIEQVFDLGIQLRNVDTIFARVFGPGSAPDATREPAGATRAS
jgi:adenylosuccinate lyase